MPLTVPDQRDAKGIIIRPVISVSDSATSQDYSFFLPAVGSLFPLRGFLTKELSYSFLLFIIVGNTAPFFPKRVAVLRKSITPT